MRVAEPGCVVRHKWLWTCAVSIFLTAAAVDAQAQTLDFTASFNWAKNGVNPSGAMVQAPNGNLYGITIGGANGSYGMVYKMTPSGTIVEVHATDEPDGLLLATDGNMYGVNFGSGPANNYAGTIFRVTMSGEFTTLYSFCAETKCYDGANPLGALVQGADGYLYGVTNAGGYSNKGTLFKIGLDGSGFQRLHSFCSAAHCADGDYARGSLIQGSDGNLYGTTSAGGMAADAHDCNQYSGGEGCGTIFKISPTGEGFVSLYSFCSLSACADGFSPNGGLVQASDGNLYGTTGGGGIISLDGGVVFRLSLGDTPGLTVLHDFCTDPNCGDGKRPAGGLIEATDGNLYGTTQIGGIGGTAGYGGNGTVFQITTSGVLKTLYALCPDPQSGCPNGQLPDGPLFQATNGWLYGTALNGGSTPDYPEYCNGGYCGAGTIFGLSVGLSPFVRLLSASGEVGSQVRILGTDLTGASRVSFNGVAAKFRVDAFSEITAFVPEGATTGTVEVVTPSAVLESNVPFVIP